jgi:hypothetical protein
LIVIHGGYLPPSSGRTLSGLFFWGEGPYVPTERDRHPRALEVTELESALRAGRAPLGTPSRLGKGVVKLYVPARHGRPVPSMAALREAEDYASGPAGPRGFEVDALFPPPLDAVDLLLHTRDLRPPLAAGEDLEYWAEAARFLFDLLLRRRVAPQFDEDPPRWAPILSGAEEKERSDRLAAAMPPVGRAASSPEEPAGPRGFAPADVVLRAFLDETTDALARELIRDVVPAERRRAGASAESRLVVSLAAPRGGEPTGADPSLLARLHAWTLPLVEPLPPGALRLGVRLSPPREDHAGNWHLLYHLESVDDPSLQLFADEIFGPDEGALRRLGRRVANPEETLLLKLGEAAALSRAIERSLEERHPSGAELTLEEAHRFLAHEAPLLSGAGVHVYLPSEGTTHPSVRLHGVESGWKAGAVTRFGLSTLVDFDWKIAIGDTLLTPAEFEELAAQKVPLVSVRGEWVLLDKASVERTLRLFDRRPGGRTTLGDFLRLAGGLEGEPGYAVDSVTAEGWLSELLDPEDAKREIAATGPPKGLHGTLRPYQVRGVGWLRFLSTRGLGACLADDMGLGKTVQLLAALLSAKEAGETIRPSLLVCPTSVAETWLREAARFSPQIHVTIHHGPDRAGSEELGALLERTDLLVTTYALAHRDRALLSEVAWEWVALDEAQNVKNPAAAQSRAVRSFPAKRRAALTGTPVENRLSELKSIFDFLNPGLLGSDEEFRREFAVPIERHRDPAAVDRLRTITAPFLLRRAKTDPLVAPDLPEKIETKELVGLTPEQASLYRATTKTLLSNIGGTRGARRRARVLTLLLRLKQICDHPALFLGDGSVLAGRSSKLSRLLDMLEETLAEARPALVFTQFAEMGHLLVDALRERFGTEVLFLHGGVPRPARAEMVRRFQEDEDSPPFFVLSLKAGGSGLNLTRASHVFHFDRWWNPAVEDQATDRAFRIGQTRSVQVHKFVARGTLEERIDAMIEEKKELASAIAGAGESWIADLDDGALAALVGLSKDAVEAERP